MYCDQEKLFKFLSSNIKLVIVVSPNLHLTAQIQQEMLALEKIGVSFAVNTNLKSEYLYTQIVSKEKVTTLYNQSAEVSCFNEYWLESQSLSYKSTSYPELQLQKFSFDFKAIESYENEFHRLKIDEDFDADSIDGFAEKFWSKILPISKLNNPMNDDVVEIEYSDRYLQSPANIILISSIFKEVKKLLGNRPKFTITTSFKNKQVQEEKLYSDFRQLDEFKNFFVNYFEDQLSQKLNLHVSRSKIDHPRYFILTLKSGKKVDIRLDQGVGYWQIKYFNWRKIQEKGDFPFLESIKKQLLWIDGNNTNMYVVSEEGFKTDLYITKS